MRLFDYAPSANCYKVRLLLANLWMNLELEPVPEPLLAPLTGLRWEMLWSSEDPRYGGSGAPPPEWAVMWRLGLSLQHSVRPRVRHCRRGTHVLPISMHASQTSTGGGTSAIASACGQAWCMASPAG